MDPNEGPAENIRLAEDASREKNWKRFGPYLAERQWGTVREDYSPSGDAWEYFPHDHARTRAYRWGEDGLLGITDREGRLCFALALWNGIDPILKERLYGLTGPEGNHGEDVKEMYFYLDSTPTHSYLKAMYRYPQAEYPYDLLVEENRRRGKEDPEFELLDTGVFDGGRYFDIVAEYAKASPNDILIRITTANRGPEPARLTLLPTLWFRNTWSWGRTGEGYWPKPSIRREGAGILLADHASLGRCRLFADFGPDGESPALLFTENETNFEKLYGDPNRSPFVKDAFHEYVIRGKDGAVNPEGTGTKAAARYSFAVPAGGERTVRLRLSAEEESPRRPFGAEFERTFRERIREAEEFYGSVIPAGLPEEERRVVRQAFAGLLWTKQFYHYSVRHWLEGDPSQPKPAGQRKRGRNHDWRHLYNRDVISVPDKWEYPWYAAWDLAFHTVPFAKIDPHFAKGQLILFLREWYMHPNGPFPSSSRPPLAGAACSDPRVHAGRERISLPVRDPVAVPDLPGPYVHFPSERSGVPGGIRARGVEDGAVRRELEMARAGLASGELPADRGPHPVSPFLRRHPARGVPDRLGATDGPGRRRDRPGCLRGGRGGADPERESRPCLERRNRKRRPLR